MNKKKFPSTLIVALLTLPVAFFSALIVRLTEIKKGPWWFADVFALIVVLAHPVGTLATIRSLKSLRRNPTKVSGVVDSIAGLVFAYIVTFAAALALKLTENLKGD